MHRLFAVAALFVVSPVAAIAQNAKAEQEVRAFLARRKLLQAKRSRFRFWTGSHPMRRVVVA